MENLAQIAITLINSMAVLTVVGYVITRSKLYNEIMEKNLSWQNQLIMIGIFGLLSIYGTLSGFKIFGAIANTRDLGPALAGLIAGPVVGVGAGLIGAVHRFTLGGFTQVSCSLATVLAGIIVTGKHGRNFRYGSRLYA